MPRPTNATRSQLRADFAPAHAIKRRFGLSAWTLQRLALAGEIRHESRPAVFQTYSLEDVERYVASLASQAAEPQAAAK